tara:strand:- start:157 stop:336 length:180 start_codon:yes stop_codon:yes gene_type:complete
VATKSRKIAQELLQIKSLETVPKQLTKYPAPQIHEQIFSGNQDVKVRGDRKKLSSFSKI